LLGAGAMLRRNLFLDSSDALALRFDGMVGYRYLTLREQLRINEALVSTDVTGTVQQGTHLDVEDRFATRNDFNGVDFGFQAGFFANPWSLNVIGKLALGCTQSVVDVDGSTRITAVDGTSVISPGGLLALGNRLGRLEQTTFSVVPELNVNLSRRFGDRVAITLGYSLLYWSNVARTGGQVDLGLNPNLLPPSLLGADPRPAPEINRTGLWLQGVNAGVSFRF
jgi:hypothetical protein